MHLIDKQNDIAVRDDFRDHALDPLFKLSSVLGAGHHTGQVHGQKPFIPDCRGHIAVHDPLREAFHDRSLSDAGFTDQAGIVLGPSAQDLNDPADLVLSSDHGIQSALSGKPGQIPAVLREDPLLLRIRAALILQIVLVSLGILPDR